MIAWMGVLDLRDAPMAFAIMLLSSFFGFISAVFSGLILGFSFLESFGVYFATGLAFALLLFTLRGIFCAAARRLA